MPLPILDEAKAWDRSFIEPSKYVYGTGNVKSGFTGLRDVGRFLARILADPRTLNRYVFCWSEELTQNEIMALAREVSGKDFDPIPVRLSLSRPVHVTHISLQITEAELLAIPREGVSQVYFEYMYSLWIRGDSVIANAVKPEYGSALDAQKLYPDLKLQSMREFTIEWYKP